MDIGNLFLQVLTLFIIMGIGVIGKLTGIITREAGKKMSELLVYITAPALIVVSMNFTFSPVMLANAGYVLIISFCIHGFAILAGLLLFRRFESYTKKIAIFAVVFSNCQFLGFPVVKSLFGDIGLFYASIYSIAFTLLIWTFGVALLKGSGDRKSILKALTNPGLIAVFVGMILFLFSLKIPGFLYDSLKIVGDMTIPLAMLFIGSQLAEIKPIDILSGFKVYYISFIRLLLIPLALLGVLRLLGVTGIAAAVCVVLAGMPTAANTAIFSEMFTGEASFASRCVVITTLLSILTIPLVITLASL